MAAQPDDGRDLQALNLPHAGRRVLIADDDPVNLEVTTQLLAEIGVVVVGVADGMQAVAAASSEDFDLVLMDLQMPILDGFDAARQIRTIPRNAKTPIVALTACVFAEDRWQCMEAGMNGFLGKPVSAEVLFGAVIHWLESARR